MLALGVCCIRILFSGVYYVCGAKYINQNGNNNTNAHVRRIRQILAVCYGRFGNEEALIIEMENGIKFCTFTYLALIVLLLLQRPLIKACLVLLRLIT